MTSNPEVPLLDMYHSKCLSKVNKLIIQDTVQISSKNVNSQGPNENKIDSNCIISWMCDFNLKYKNLIVRI